MKILWHRMFLADAPVLSSGICSYKYIAPPELNSIFLGGEYRKTVSRIEKWNSNIPPTLSHRDRIFVAQRSWQQSAIHLLSITGNSTLYEPQITDIEMPGKQILFNQKTF